MKDKYHGIWITYSGSHAEVSWVLKGVIKRDQLREYILFALNGHDEWSGALRDGVHNWHQIIREVLESEYPEYLGEYDKLAVLI